MTPEPLPPSYAPPADLLRGRTILVTGAASGLGRATALACARHGATVVLAGRSAHKLEKVYDEIRQAGGPEPALAPLNLATASWSDHAACAATLEREFGALHGLVHAAAHFHGLTPLAQLEPKTWLETLQVNLTAVFALTAHCLPLLRKPGDASIVCVSDAAGRSGRAYTGAYGVAKFGLEGLVQIWAQELEAEGRVRCNSLDPGPLATALRRKGWVGDPAGTTRAPEAVTPALLWLLGPASRGRSGRAYFVAE